MNAPIDRAQELAKAQAAVAEGDLTHAVHHLGCALAAQLDHPDHRLLLEELARRGPENLAALVEPEKDGSLFYGIGAVQAWLHKASGDPTQALSLALQCLPVWPEHEIAKWIDEWLREAEFARAVDPGKVLRFTTDLASDPDAGVADPALAVLRSLAAAHPESGETVLVLCRALRQRGKLDEAVAVAREAARKQPGYHAFVALGTNLREAGEVEQAIEAFRTAAEYAPGDEAVWLDIGDLCLRRRNLGGARVAYEEALERDGASQWALASLAFIRHRLTGEPEDIAELERLARLEGNGQRAAALLAETEPWVRGLPYTGEATLKILPKIAATKLDPGSTARFEVSAIEAPSALRELALHLAVTNPGLRFEVSVTSVQKPDPREPIRRGLFRRPKVVLWRYDGTSASPGVPEEGAAPPALLELAQSRYDLVAWSARAKELAAALPGTSALLSAMVHVPALPEGWLTPDWMLRVQIAAALVLAHRGELDLLRDVAYGPMDWTGIAAILALGQLAVEKPQHDARLAEDLRELLHHEPEGGHWPLEHPLLSTLLRLGSLTEDQRADLRRRRNMVEAE